MIIEKPFYSYNERRYGKPWGAIITFSKLKPEYTFTGHYDARPGDAGSVVIEAQPGDILAFGQKDNRGNKTEKQFYIVNDKGELLQISEREARLHYQTKSKQPTTPAD